MKMDLSLLRSKFRGTMLGAVVGDCLGSPYQFETILSAGMMIVLQKSFDTLEKPSYKAPVIQYTDDSAMTRSLAESLIEKKELDLPDIAKKFAKSYFKEPNRGYSDNLLPVFHKWRNNKFNDILGPAKEQFNGQGSWGNGGAMRAAPLSLFCYNNYDALLDMVRKQTELTHTHIRGINGAILQAIAIHQCLHLNPTEELNPVQFIDDLIAKMDKIEEKAYDTLGPDGSESQPFKGQLDIAKSLLLDREAAHVENVSQELGTEVSALYSVPTAIFCFLYAQESVPSIETDNPLRRTIQYAISLGGDTDTIASMAGAIAGAFYGEEKFNSATLKNCEATEEFRKLGDQLFDIAMTV